MKKLIYLFLVLAVFSCKNSTNKPEETAEVKSTKAEHKTKEDLQTIPKEVQLNLDEYTSLMDSLSVSDISSIQVLKNYIINTLNVSDELSDSAYYMFLEFFYASANNLNDSLETKYSTVVRKIYMNKEDSETIEFKRLLDECGLNLSTTRGYFYVDVQPDFFYETFKNNTSPSINTFLELRDRELKNTFAEDARLIISFNDLAERIYDWDQYLKNYPDTRMKIEADYFLETYLETYLTGMENTKLFDSKSRILIPEVKQSYESYLMNHGDTKSGMIVQEYYDILKRNHFEYSDSIDYILKKYDLNLMHGIQPLARL